MGVDEVMKFVEEKRKYLERGMGMGVDGVMKFVVEKLKEALLAVENLGGDALAWFDKVFPPETRASTASHWFHLALPWIIAAVALTVLFYFCRCFCRCFCGFWRCFWRCCCGCWRCFCRCCCGCWRCFCRCCCRGRVKMMKAPGRNCMMPRSMFEANTQGYFRNLRAHPGDHLC